LPLGFAFGEKSSSIQESSPQAVVARLRGDPLSGEAILYAAFAEPSFCTALLQVIERRRRLRGAKGEATGTRTSAFRKVAGDSAVSLEAKLLRAEQSNTSILYGNQLILKAFRKVDVGVNPDLEIGRFLTERVRFPYIPPVLGAIEYQPRRGEPMSLAILQAFVPNQGDAWRLTLDSLGRFYEEVLARHIALAEPLYPTDSLMDLLEQEMSAQVAEPIGPYLDYARRLGECTAEMHLALASDARDPAFAPEAFSTLYQRSIYQGMRTLANQTMNLLKVRSKYLSAAQRGDAQKVLELEAPIQKQFQALVGRKITAMRTRVHGDYHLGQVLYTGKGFVIIDFEGEPARAISERRIKRSPLRDVAGMIRSFHYAAYTPLLGQVTGASLQPSKIATAEPWAKAWFLWVSAAFLSAYLRVSDDAPFIPKTTEELEILLNAYLLEKALYELSYEFYNRPEWIALPLKGIRQILNVEAETAIP